MRTKSEKSILPSELKKIELQLPSLWGEYEASLTKAKPETKPKAEIKSAKKPGVHDYRQHSTFGQPVHEKAVKNLMKYLEKYGMTLSEAEDIADRFPALKSVNMYIDATIDQIRAEEGKPCIMLGYETFISPEDYRVNPRKRKYRKNNTNKCESVLPSELHDCFKETEYMSRRRNPKLKHILPLVLIAGGAVVVYMLLSSKSPTSDTAVVGTGLTVIKNADGTISFV